jgi:hypothetical protein
VAVFPLEVKGPLRIDHAQSQFLVLQQMRHIGCQVFGQRQIQSRYKQQ